MTRIIGIGVDVLHLPRLVSLTSRHTAGSSRLAARILSRQELAHWKEFDISEDQKDASLRFLGVRWAIKEAAYKAVYPVVKPTWKEFTFLKICDDVANLKPVLEYHPLKVDQGGSVINAAMKMHASVSHDGEYIFATVLAEGV